MAICIFLSQYQQICNDNEEKYVSHHALSDVLSSADEYFPEKSHVYQISLNRLDRIQVLKKILSA